MMPARTGSLDLVMFKTSPPSGRVGAFWKRRHQENYGAGRPARVAARDHAAEPSRHITLTVAPLQWELQGQGTLAGLF